MRSNKMVLATLLAATLGASTRAARADVDVDARAKDIVKSLVIVEYTVRNENVSREESAQGILIHKDGVILISGNVIPESFPAEWIKDIKIRLPLKNFTAVPARLLGRTQNHLFAFLKTDKPIDAPVFTPGDMAPTRLGQSVFSVGMLGKSGGYEKCVGVSQIKTIAELTHTVVATASFGLTRGSSPVFDLASGKCVGLTLPAIGENMILRDSNGMRAIELVDDEQSSAFLPGNEVTALFHNIPTDTFQVQRPWLGVDEVTGLQEDVRDLKKIDQVAGVMLGSIIPGEAADKAGLLPQDIILTIDGKQFSQSPVPDLMKMHFSRAIEEHHVGDDVAFGILRDGKKMEVKVKLTPVPKTSGEMAHVFSPRVGITTRDLVFYDTYARHLPTDTRGVMVALVKAGGPASLGATPLHGGMLITKVDDQPVENQKQFLDIMKKSDQNTDAKEMVFVVIQPNGETQVCHVDLTK